MSFGIEHLYRRISELERENNHLREGIKLAIINYDGGSMFQSDIINILRDLLKPQKTVVQKESGDGEK